MQEGNLLTRLYRCISRYRLAMRAFTVPFPVLHRRGVVGVGVAVVAEVRATDSQSTSNVDYLKFRLCKL
jgi:hypothetical protein